MKYKKSRFKRLFKLKDKCQAHDCNYIFKDGDTYKVLDELLCNIKVCKHCYLKACNAEADAIERHRQREIKKKRADYKILAEEIVKLM